MQYIVEVSASTLSASKDTHGFKGLEVRNLFVAISADMTIEKN